MVWLDNDNWLGGLIGDYLCANGVCQCNGVCGCNFLCSCDTECGGGGGDENCGSGLGIMAEQCQPSQQP